MPCDLKIRTDIILGKLTQQQMAFKKNKEDENFEYEQKEFEIKKGESIKLHNFNLKTEVNFLFTLDTHMGQSAT